MTSMQIIPASDMLAQLIPCTETLPEEVLTSILERACLYDDDAVGRLRDRLSRVSRKWRHIIHHTSSFWSVLHLSPSQTPDHLLQSLDIHLERSKEYPLTIHLQCYWHPRITSTVFERIIPHSHRWKRLSIQTPSDDVFSYLKNVPTPLLEAVEFCLFSWEKVLERPQPTFPMTNLSNLSTLILQNMTLGEVISLPRLKKLDLRGNVTWRAYFQLCDALDGSLVLEHLTLHLRLFDVPGSEEPRVERSVPISLPALRDCFIITSEGLSPKITRLTGLLSCPNLASMAVQDADYAGEGQTLLRLTTSRGVCPSETTGGSPPLYSQIISELYVRSSDLYLAWSSLSPAPSLTVLELRASQWPTRDRLEGIFNALVALETLVLREFQASTALQEIGVGLPVTLPSLQTLDIEFQRTRNSQDYHVSQFFRLLLLPHLHYLRLRGLLSNEWGHLLCSSYFPSLRSLILVDMKDFLGSTSDPILTFPILTDLQLVNVRSNDFIRRLVQETGLYPRWPELRTLTILGDDLVSKPLLHKVVSSRREIGLRFSKLVLDSYCVNEESRDWLARHCNVELMP